jgi:hypothetical protein
MGIEKKDKKQRNVSHTKAQRTQRRRKAFLREAFFLFHTGFSEKNHVYFFKPCGLCVCVKEQVIGFIELLRNCVQTQRTQVTQVDNMTGIYG